MTAVKGFLRQNETNTGSNKVLWLHTYKWPLVLLWDFECLGFVSLSCIPVRAKIGMARSKGNEKAIMALIMARADPKGNHMNVAVIASGVGLKASLPSWNISDFEYLSLGSECQFLFSPSFTK